MFTFNFVYKALRFFKSGFLIDFLFKKTIFNFLKLQFIYYNNFAEKYYVEYLFLKIKNSFAYLFSWVDLFNDELVFALISVFVFVLFLLVFFF